MPIEGLETYEPDGAVPWPLVLVEGEPGAGKTWELVEFLKQSPNVGEGYWIPLDEGGAARYYGGRLPGVRKFEILKLKTGDYHEILEKIRVVKAHAQKEADAGHPPVVLVIDTASGIWDALRDWVNARARDTRRAKALLAQDPNAEVPKPGRNLWNDADARWRALAKELRTFPGICVVTARGKEISATDPNTGQPLVDDRTKQAIKEWSVEIKPAFEFMCDVWLRKRREEGTFVVRINSVEHGRKPGSDESKQLRAVAPESDGRLLDWALFDVLGLDPTTAYAADFKEFGAGGLTDAERVQDPEHQQQQRPTPPPRARRPLPSQMAKRVAEAPDLYDLREVWMEYNRVGLLQVEVELPGGVYTVDELITARKETLEEEAKRAEKEGAEKPEAAGQQAPAEEGEGVVNALVGEQQPEVPPTTVQGAVATAMTGSRPKTGRERTAEQVEAEKKGSEPDDPDLCKNSAARRGILSSIEGMGISEAQIVEHFGRPLEQIATRRITGFVQDAVRANQREKAGARG